MSAKPSKRHYENNPFFIASSGITLLFNLAQGVAIMLIILSVLGLFGNAFSPPPDPNARELTSADFMNTFSGWTTTEWLMLGAASLIIGLAIIMISALFTGVSAYTSARLAQNEDVRIRTAFAESFDKLWGFIWLQIIVFVKVLLWSLLFIIPGIIMAVRYSLANVAFFDDTQNLRGNDAIKESLRLTKGAWITTYASTALFNMLTFFAISSVVSTGANAVLYRQLQEHSDKKPAAHWLSWLTLVLPFALISLIIFGLIAIAIVVGLLGQKTI
ncbi:MAG: hypothetical protein JWO07_383 [Candidatus Saccharibacteria bacterium]|nr:hypothetical protein [Candidatus Saccharibacteria bacterium]